jgi:hypothetical protein
VRTIGELTDAARASLAAKRIFFGHQSVGGNIMDGVADLVQQHPSLGIKIVRLDEVPDQPGGFFADADIGRNEQPTSKTAAFAGLMDEGLADSLDIAFHKYCFVDVTRGMDVRNLFASYESTMTRLRAAHPRVTFVHVTVPLMTAQSGPKAAVKKLIGRPPAGYQDNFAREEFNDLMRRAYSGREPVFDLAAIESAAPDGRQETISFQGTQGRALFPPYTTDGGHLNDRGRRRVAEELIVFLAQLPASR